MDLTLTNGSNTTVIGATTTRKTTPSLVLTCGATTGYISLTTDSTKATTPNCIIATKSGTTYYSQAPDANLKTIAFITPYECGWSWGTTHLCTGEARILGAKDTSTDFCCNISVAHNIDSSCWAYSNAYDILTYVETDACCPTNIVACVSPGWQHCHGGYLNNAVNTVSITPIINNFRGIRAQCNFSSLPACFLAGSLTTCYAEDSCKKYKFNTPSCSGANCLCFCICSTGNLATTCYTAPDNSCTFGYIYYDCCTSIYKAFDTHCHCNSSVTFCSCGCVESCLNSGEELNLHWVDGTQYESIDCLPTGTVLFTNCSEVPSSSWCSYSCACWNAYPKDFVGGCGFCPNKYNNFTYRLRCANTQYDNMVYYPSGSKYAYYNPGDKSYCVKYIGAHQHYFWDCMSGCMLHFASKAYGFCYLMVKCA